MNNFEYKENNKQFLVSVGLQSKANSIHELNKDYKHRYKDEVVVVKTIMLSDKDFEQFINALLGDYNFIKDNEKLYKVEIVDIDYARLDKVMLITSQVVDFGIIVDTQGYDYARYTAYYKKNKTPHERLLELGFKLTGENEKFKYYTHQKALSNMITISKTTKNISVDGKIDLELAEILVDYLKELENDN